MGTEPRRGLWAVIGGFEGCPAWDKVKPLGPGSNPSCPTLSLLPPLTLAPPLPAPVPCCRWALPGAERQDSVFNGLQQVRDGAALVAVHDSARPLVTPADASK